MTVPGSDVPGRDDPNSDVVVVGAAGVDTNVFLSTPLRPLDHMGEGQFAENIDYVGQAGGYSSRGFARLGHRTAFVGHVGADFAGDMVRAELAADGIDLRGLDIDPAGTARSVNVMGLDGSRVNFYDGRGHEKLDVDPDLAREVFAGARVVLFHLPDWSRRLLPLARESGAVIACDLQDIRDPDDSYRREFIEAADVLFVSSAHHHNPSHMLKRVVELSDDALVICGRGGLGAAVASADGIEVFPPPRVTLPIVDTNGAGDALAVGFLDARYFRDCSIADSISYGQLAARWTCAQRADSSRLVTRDQLTDLAAQIGLGAAVAAAG
jgi:acarbose 7IV-phosphotransferase